MIRAATPGAATPHKSPRDHHARTTCDCEKCRDVCYNSPGVLIPGDCERIAEHLRERVALELFRASPGPMLSCPGSGKTFRVPVIVPAQFDTSEGPHCVFLDEEARCKIHQAAPYGCGWFDVHQTAKERDARSIAGLSAIAANAPYKGLWQILYNAGLRSKAPEKKTPPQP